MRTLISDLKSLKLISDNAGFTEFFNDAIADLDACVFGSLIIDDEMSDCQGGVYCDVEAVDCVELPARDALYDAENNTLSMSLEGMLTFIHEIGHFRHLSVDKGKYSCPLLADRVPARTEMLANDKDDSFRYSCEFEAGYRCVVADIMYGIFDTPTIAADNLRNLICYRKQSYPWYLEQSKYLQQGHLNEIGVLSSFVLQVCERFMESHRFTDLYKIDCVSIELTDEERDILTALTT